MTRLTRTMLCSTVLAAGGFAASAAQVQQIEPDERTELSAGMEDAGQAAWNMALVHALPKPEGFFDPEAVFDPAAFGAMMRARMQAQQAAEDSGEEIGDEDLPPLPRYVPLALANTDIAFSGDHMFVGNYHGFNVYDISSEGGPDLAASVVCTGGQNDVSVHGDLLFMSVEHNRARLDCSAGDPREEISAERFRGIRIFDVSDLSNIRQVGAVQTCRGSHTHTIVPDPEDEGRIYIYNSATSSVRGSEELDICSDGQPEDNPDTALYSIDVISVDLDDPGSAAIVNRPRIFADYETGDVAGLWRGGRAGVATQRTAQTNHCHDITAFPELGIAAGACSGNGILLDITDPLNPARIDELFDPDMAYWHSATFNNTGDTILFTDEWGGGIGARCTADSPSNWGANLIATLEGREMQGQSYFKLPTVQGETENCVAHNGSLVPVPGRDIFVQSWYQGGISVIDFTDPQNVYEIAYFDRGPLSEDTLLIGGYWSAYWHGGKIYGAEIARGLDVLELRASDHLSEAELAAAMRAITPETANVQTQYRIEWEDHPDVGRAYLDQLQRSEAITPALADTVADALDRWAQGSTPGRRLADQVSAAGDDAEGVDARRIAELASLLRRAAG